MDKTIINLRSWAYAGKTTTLKKLNFLLTQERCTDVEIKKIFTYHGVKVGITSLGDYREAIEERLGELIANQCDVIFCATRTKGDTVNCLEQLAGKHGYKKIIIGSIWAYNPEFRDICNSQLSETMKGLLDKLIESPQKTSNL